jgi:hypothetical protein
MAGTEMDMVGVSNFWYSSNLYLYFRMYFHKSSMKELQKIREKWQEW